LMSDGIAMRTRERLCSKLRLNVLRSHGLNPSTDHFEGIPYQNELPSGLATDLGAGIGPTVI
jgi:hypothetical protein